MNGWVGICMDGCMDGVCAYINGWIDNVEVDDACSCVRASVNFTFALSASTCFRSNASFSALFDLCMVKREYCSYVYE